MDGFTPWPTIWYRKLVFSQQISRENARAATLLLTKQRREREEVEREVSDARSG